MATRTSQVNRIIGLWVVLCLAVMISRCWAGLQHTCSSDTRTQTPRGICGRNLSNLLAMLCKSGYNKRSGPSAAASSLLYKLAGSRNEDMATSHIGPMSDVELGPDSEAADDNLLNQSSAFVPRRVALSLLRSRRQIGVFGVAFRRGIHCECCIHQCAYKELMEYCRSTDSPLIQ